MSYESIYEVNNKVYYIYNNPELSAKNRLMIFTNIIKGRYFSTEELKSGKYVIESDYGVASAEEILFMIENNIVLDNVTVIYVTDKSDDYLDSLIPIYCIDFSSSFLKDVRELIKKS